MEEALLLSLKLSLATTLILLLASLGISYLLVFKSFPFKSVLEATLLSPIVLPPTVLGFYLLLLLGGNSPVGRVLEGLFGEPLVFSFWSILIASVVYSLPFGVFPVKEAFASVPKRFIEIAQVFGYSKTEAFLRVVLPNSLSGILTSCALVFSHTMGEFGVILMVGGNIPGETRTLSIYIYDQVQALNYSEAHRASLLLLGVSLISLIAVFGVRRRWIRV